MLAIPVLEVFSLHCMQTTECGMAINSAVIILKTMKAGTIALTKIVSFSTAFTKEINGNRIARVHIYFMHIDTNPAFKNQQKHSIWFRKAKIS